MLLDLMDYNGLKLSLQDKLLSIHDTVNYLLNTENEIISTIRLENLVSAATLCMDIAKEHAENICVPRES